MVRLVVQCIRNQSFTVTAVNRLLIFLQVTTTVYSSIECRPKTFVIIHADYSHRSKTFIGVCVCVCVFVLMIKPKRLKLQSPNLPSRVLVQQLILGQKVKGQGHRATKCKNMLKVIGVSLCTFIECPASSFHVIHCLFLGFAPSTSLSILYEVIMEWNSIVTGINS